MFRVIAEIVAAVLTASAILVGHVRGDEIKPVPLCVTESMVLTRMNGMAPRFVLQGDRLAEFQRTVKAMTGIDPPKDDEVLIFGDGNSSENKLLFISFKDGCITHAFTTPANELLKFMEGA